jgi:hypothetical protein
LPFDGDISLQRFGAPDAGNPNVGNDFLDLFQGSACDNDVIPLLGKTLTDRSPNTSGSANTEHDCSRLTHLSDSSK